MSRSRLWLADSWSVSKPRGTDRKFLSDSTSQNASSPTLLAFFQRRITAELNHEGEERGSLLTYSALYATPGADQRNRLIS